MRKLTKKTNTKKKEVKIKIRLATSSKTIRNNKKLIIERKASPPSPGEKIISKFLRKNKIKFEREWYHPTLINPETGSLLFLDFYLPKIKVAIEFDGRQHREPLYGKVQLLKQKNRDKVKDEWCAKNGITMVRIKTWERTRIELKLLTVIY